MKIISDLIVRMNSLKSKIADLELELMQLTGTGIDQSMLRANIAEQKRLLSALEIELSERLSAKQEQGLIADGDKA